MTKRRYNQPPAAWFRQQVIDLQTGNPQKRDKILASLSRELLPVLRRIAITQQRREWLGAHSWEIAEDAVSHAFIKFMQKLGEFREPYDIVSWFYMVIRNYMRDERHRLGRVLYTEADYLLDREAHDTTGVLSIARELREIVSHLPADDRLLIYLHYWEEVSIRDIAAQRGVSHQAVSNQHRLIKKRLKTLLIIGGTKDARWADTRTS